MRSLILSMIIKILVPLFLVFTTYMFFRGHNNPGGGFIAGLIGSIPFMIHSMAFGSEETMRSYKIKPLFMAATGLFLAAFSGMFSVIAGKPFMTALWIDKELPLIGKLGTPIFFDLGVLLVVIGVVLRITFLLREE